MEPVAEPRATGFGSGTKEGGGERNGCATSLYAEGSARRGRRLCTWLCAARVHLLGDRSLLRALVALATFVASRL